MTQLCWDMDQFRYWLDAIRAAGIWMPVDVGIMPSWTRLPPSTWRCPQRLRHAPGPVRDHLQELDLPNPFVKDPFDADVEGKKASFKAAGIEYTINQIDEYRACGINGIHLYGPEQVRRRGLHRQGSRSAGPDLIANQGGGSASPTLFHF